MSGLFGIVDTTGKTDVGGYLDRVQTETSHFSWYTSDTWTAADAPVGLGCSGIGIFNREPQPVISRDGHLVLFMSGELYRISDLLKRLATCGTAPRNLSHPELFLTAYECLGEDFANALDGAYVAAIYNIEQRLMTIISDRMGHYPTYYAHETGRLVFAPEVKGVLCAPFLQRKLSVTAMAEYFRFQHLLENETFHEGILRFPYGTIGEFDLTTGAWKLRQYWDWDHIPMLSDILFEDAVVEGSRILREAIQEISSDDLRPGVFLSGGLDSRAIVGFLAQHKSSPVTATFGVRNSRDVYYAERISRAVGSRHFWFDFPDGKWVAENVEMHLTLTEGFHHWVHMHGITMLPQLRPVMDYNLTGWDGGTVMGHPDAIQPVLNQPVDSLALVSKVYEDTVRIYNWPGLTESEERMLYAPEFSKQAVGLAFDSIREAFQRYKKYREDYQAEYFYIRNHCFRQAQNMVTIARSHTEVRFPFWDRKLLDFIYSLNPKIRANRFFYRSIITRELPRLATIPFDKQEYLPTVEPLRHNLQALSVKVGRRLGVYPKRPTLYADYEDYLRHDLREWAASILFDPRTEQRGILNMEFVRSLFERHMSGYEEWTIGKIAPLITFEMMMRQYFD